MTTTRVTDITGLTFQGAVTASYDELEAAFGPPRGGSPDGKTRAEWWLRFPDGCLATIYDWRHREPVEDVREWHVGGHNSHALEHVRKELEG